MEDTRIPLEAFVDFQRAAVETPMGTVSLRYEAAMEAIEAARLARRGTYEAAHAPTVQLAVRGRFPFEVDSRLSFARRFCAAELGGEGGVIFSERPSTELPRV